MFLLPFHKMNQSADVPKQSRRAPQIGPECANSTIQLLLLLLVINYLHRRE